MNHHICPWWAGYIIDNPLRRWIHNPDRILAPHVRPGMTVLDFGCGMGLFGIAAARLAGEHGRVIAVDLQPQMLEVLTRRATRARVAHRIHTHRCEADALNIEQTAFADLALAIYSAHEVPDQRRLLRELRACLRPAGQLLIVEPRRHVPAQDFEAMLSFARELGFEETERPSVRLSMAVVLRKTQ